MKKLIKTITFVLLFAFIMQIIPSNLGLLFSAEQTQLPPVTEQPANQTAQEPYIISEITEKREENTKHFRMSDGTIQAAQYMQPIHYQKNGKWVDYDNTLNQTIDEGLPSLQNKESDFHIILSKKTNSSKLIRIEKDGYTLSWNFNGIAKKEAQPSMIKEEGDLSFLKTLNTEVLYNDIFTDVDLQYILSSNYLKENIILNSASAQKEFEIDYKSSQLTPELINNNTLQLLDKDGTVIFIINAPYMQDSAGEICNHITYQITQQKNNKFTLKMILDQTWLSSPDRQFPVTVDPAIIIPQTNTGFDSTYVSSQYPDYAFGNQSEILYVGSGNGLSTARSFLKVPSLPYLSTADSIIDARINLCLVDNNISSTIYVLPINGDWNASTATWNNMDALIHYNSYQPTGLCDYQDIPVINNAQGDPAEWITWEITKLAQDWYRDPSSNHGIAFTLDSEHLINRGSAIFATEDNPNTSARPIMTIIYRNMSGYEDYYSYTSMAAGRKGIASVNNYNGNLIFTQYLTEDCGGEVMPVTISLIYNSNKWGTNYSRLGPNMQSNYHMFVMKNDRINESSTEDEKKYKYVFCDADSTEHYFYFENLTDTTGKDEDGLGYTLTVNESVA